jgi:phage tail protein X
MASRLRTLKIKNINRKRTYRALKYPEIPLSIEDLYITTTDGDRLDLLANQFYQDVDMWWVIATANPGVVKRDTFNLKPGLEIRVPANPQGVMQEFESLNK